MQGRAVAKADALQAPVWALVALAEVAAEMYEQSEHPSDYGDEGTMALLAEWFPKLRDALDHAGLLLR